jgi:hypothetical protein
MSTNKQSINIAYRLSPEAYAQVESKCYPINVGTTTTDLQVAYVNGQQSVLKMLRENIVVGS